MKRFLYKKIPHNLSTASKAECLTSKSASSVIEEMCFLISSLIDALSHFKAMSL